MSQLSDAVHCAYDKGYEQGYMDGKNDADRDIAMLQTRLYKTSESMSKVMMFETSKPIAVIHSDGGQTTFYLGYEQGKKDAVKHGRWERVEHYAPYWKCQVCGFEMPMIAGEGVESNAYSYCPNCGAKMDTEEGAEHE